MYILHRLVVHGFSPSTHEVEADRPPHSNFQTIWATKRNPVLKNQKPNQKKTKPKQTNNQ